jgi:hypothetical protein
MKARLVLAAVLSALAGAALAQAPGASSPSAPAPAASAPAASPGATVSGVTVKPLPHKACAPKDKECIAIVVAEVKELYPEQLKMFCHQQKMDVMQRDMQANMAGWCDNQMGGAAAICNHYLPPVVKQVCASDPPTAKK